MKTAINIIARNPPSILLALGGAGHLLQMDGSGILLGLGAFLQIGWLVVPRIM